MAELQLSGFSRVWIIESGAQPGNNPLYQGLMKIGDPSWAQGDVERVEIPDPARYDEFLEAAEIKGQVERPTVSIMGRMPMALSEMLKLTRRSCPFDIQAHVGKCRIPTDFNGGWEKVVIFPRSRITNYAVENFGALGSDEKTATNETADVSSQDIYEVVRLTFSEQAGATVTREIISIDVCDSVQCGDCGLPSDGCQKILATMIGAGATPGAAPAVVYSGNNGTTWASVNISTLLGNEAPSDSECVGSYFVVTSMTDEAIHYAKTDDIITLGASAVWTQMKNGFVFGKGPNTIVSAGPNLTWLAGQGGYIYFTSDPTISVTVQDAGVATTQNYADIDALDENTVVAVGASNAVAATDNGGETWQAVTGPVVGQNLSAVKVLDDTIWLVGVANGTLWYTLNSGVSWTQISLPLTGSRIDDIKFTTRSVGYLSLRVAGGRARILRTIDGGNSWYVLPEGPGQIPNNTRINQVAVCVDPNTVFGGGLGSDGTDGIIVKAE